MKALSKNTFYVKEPVTKKDPKAVVETFAGKPSKVRIWHNCEGYKKGRHGIFRVELAITASDTDTATYTCPHCGFEYVLDLNLNLAG